MDKIFPKSIKIMIISVNGIKSEKYDMSSSLI